MPEANLLGPRQAGFVIAQDRLGPGPHPPLHARDRQLRAGDRDDVQARQLTRETSARSSPRSSSSRTSSPSRRMETEQARLLTLMAAWRMDTEGKKAARREISMIKVVAANVVMDVLDRAIQVHGALGMSDDTPLAGMWRFSRMLKVADGPDEVHKMVIARRELNHWARERRRGRRERAPAPTLPRPAARVQTRSHAAVARHGHWRMARASVGDRPHGRGACVSRGARPRRPLGEALTIFANSSASSLLLAVLAGRVAGEHALEDDRQLPVAERDVEVELGEVAAGALGVARRAARRGREPGRGRRRVEQRDQVVARLRPVDHQQADVGERVAERAQLPVDDRGDLAAAARGSCCRGGSRRGRSWPGPARGCGRRGGRGRRRPAAARASSTSPTGRASGGAGARRSPPSCRARRGPTASGRPRGSRPACRPRARRSRGARPRRTTSTASRCERRIGPSTKPIT